MASEICGDGHLGLADRFRYLALNLVRNGRPGGARPRVIGYYADRTARTPCTASPGRALTEAFLAQQLPQLLPPGKLRVLEIGCGSGSLPDLLAAAGYSGEYVGIDIADRFNRADTAGFAKRFLCIDANRVAPEGTFDLVISVSALEHIPDDRTLTARLDALVRPGGLQVHVVPSAWGLPVYLWHGYRQYPLRALGERFDRRRSVAYALGGAGSFVLHLLAITCGEMLLRLPLRRRGAGLYGRLLAGCLRLDRWLPFAATMYVLCQPAAAAPEGAAD